MPHQLDPSKPLFLTELGLFSQESNFMSSPIRHIDIYNLTKLEL